MTKLHYTEKFYSIQGEGRYMGVPSVFLRMFGCNFRCKNFGRLGNDLLDDNTTHNPEVIDIIKNIDQYDNFEKLPLVETGCDSYSSIYPEFKKFVIKETANELANGICKLLPNGCWQDEHLVITGGEPLLGWQRSYPELLDHPKMSSLKEITFETNGTQKLSNEFIDYFRSWSKLRGKDNLTFSVSAKLSCSGETREDSIKPEIVCSYEDLGYTYLKFVVATEDDAEEAVETLDIYRANGFTGPCYLMPIGGIENVYSMNNYRVAKFAIDHGLRYSDRLQVPLFKNRWGT